MKYIVISVLFLVSSITLASGFKCSGEGYSVKMFNQVQPGLGTKNPAIFVVSAEQMGTVAVVRGPGIQRAATTQTISYSGMANSKATGRFMHIDLQIARSAIATGPNAGGHAALLTLNTDRGNWKANLSCESYLKN